MKLKTFKEIKPKFQVGTALVAVDVYKEQTRQEMIKWIKMLLKRANATQEYLGDVKFVKGNINVTFRTHTDIDKDIYTKSDRNLFVATWLKHIFNVKSDELR